MRLYFFLSIDDDITSLKVVFQLQCNKLQAESGNALLQVINIHRPLCFDGPRCVEDIRKFVGKIFTGCNTF